MHFPEIDLDAIEPGDILRDTNPIPVDGIPGRYTLNIGEAWRVMFAFGGVTMASAIRASVMEISIDGSDGLKPLTCDATFCAAVPCGPVGIQVEVLRSGRSGAQAITRLWALDPEDPDPTGPVGNDLVLTIVFGVFRESPFEFVGAIAPEVPGPLECPGREKFEDNPFAHIPYHRQTDFRIAFGGSPTFRRLDKPAEPRTGSWFRFVNSPLNSDGLWEPSALAVPGDVLGPPVHTGVGGEAGVFFVISLQIGLKWVGEARGDWLFQHTRSQIAANSYATGFAEIFDESRSLVAVATQTALLRPVD